MKSVLRTALFSIFSVMLTASSLPAQNAYGTHRDYNSGRDARYQVVSSYDGDRNWDRDRDHGRNRDWDRGDRDRSWGHAPYRDDRGGYYHSGHSGPGYFHCCYYGIPGYYRDRDNLAGRSAAVI